MNRDIVVIGASAGGFDAIKNLIYNLPHELGISVFIVWHISPYVRGVLPQLLDTHSKYPAAHAADGEQIERNRIYVAPPDHHLVIVENSVRITRGPKENRFRPAIDPLFRSAAYFFRERVIGIILSGSLDDGAAGLLAVKNFGGATVVQDPADAEVPSMPQNAIQTAHPQHIVPIAQMPSLIERLAKSVVTTPKEPAMENNEKTRMEIEFALHGENSVNDLFKLGDLTKYTCPDCHGVLTALKDGQSIRFRCHTGHAFSAETLLTTISDNIEENLWNTIRSIHESVFLLNHIGDHYAENNNPQSAAKYFKKAAEADMRSKVLRQLITENGHLSIDSVNDGPEIETNKWSASK